MMLRLLMIQLLVCFGIVTSDFRCVCNYNHPEYYVMPCHSNNVMPIGTLYAPDYIASTLHFQVQDLRSPFCRAVLTNVNAPAPWVPVYQPHGNIGYIYQDAGIVNRLCQGSLMFCRNNLTASSSCTHNITSSTVGVINTSPTKPQTNTGGNSHQPHPVTPTTTTTTKSWMNIGGGGVVTPSTTKSYQPIVNHHQNSIVCNGADVEHALLKQYTLFHSSARSCGVGGISAEESIIWALCKAADTNMDNWRKLYSVKGACNTIPKYSPISVFSNGKIANGDGTGIFMGCTPNGGMKLARQTCVTSHIQIETIDITPSGKLLEDIANYYVIDN